MKHLKKFERFFNPKKSELVIINENFYYKTDNVISKLFRSYYDLFLNLKEILLDDEYKLEYFNTNIIEVLQEFEDTYSNKFTKKDSEKLSKELSQLKDQIDSKVFSKTGLSEFDKLIHINIKNEESRLKLKNIIVEIKSELLNKLKPTLNFCKSQLSKNENWEIVHGLYTTQSTVNNGKYKKDKYHLLIEFQKLGEWVKDNKQKVLIIFDGRDAAGKGGTIENISEYMNPKYCRVESFGIPTDEEHKKWFKRYKNKLPKEGEIVLFDRSWYTRAYVEAPMGYCSSSEYEDFMNGVLNFEEELESNGINLVKVWLSVDQETQKYRFELRKANPLKYWKFSENDSKIINKWDDFTSYINKMLKKCNKRSNPWIIVESNDDKKSTLEVMRSILKKFEYKNKKTGIIYDGNMVLENNELNNSNNYVFLDIDGVIIPVDEKTDGDYHRFFNDISKWSKEAIETLNEVWRLYNPKIIIISSYKRNKTLNEIREKFKEAGFIGKLDSKLNDVLDYEDRFENISIYVKENNVGKFVIIDDKKHDLNKINSIGRHWLNLRTKIGLKMSDMPKIKSILYGK